MQLVPFLKGIYTDAENTRQVTPGGVKASVSFSLLELHSGSQAGTNRNGAALQERWATCRSRLRF